MMYACSLSISETAERNNNDVYTPCRVAGLCRTALCGGTIMCERHPTLVYGYSRRFCAGSRHALIIIMTVASMDGDRECEAMNQRGRRPIVAAQCLPAGASFARVDVFKRTQQSSDDYA